MVNAVEGHGDLERTEEEKQQDNREIQDLKVTFLCLCYVGELAITGGEDGVLYVWDEKQIFYKQEKAHRVS